MPALIVAFCYPRRFLAECIALAVDLADDLHDVIRMAVGLGKDEGLGRFLAAGEDLRFHRFLHRENHLPDLARVDDGAIQFLTGIENVVFGLGPTLLARLPIAMVHLFLGFEFRAFPADLGFDLEYVVAATPGAALRLSCLRSCRTQPACSSFWSMICRAFCSGVMSSRRPRMRIQLRKPSLDDVDGKTKPQRRLMRT